MQLVVKMNFKTAKKIIDTILIENQVSYHKAQFIFQHCVTHADVLNKKELEAMVMNCLGVY